MRSMRTAHLRRLLAAPGRARPFSSSQPYNPNVVNLARDPPPGKRFRWMRVFGTLACLMFAAPVVSMYYDNQRHEADMERRKQASAQS